MELTTPLADAHVASGANLAPYFGVHLPVQYGDPPAEYRCAREHAGLIDTNFRAVFSLSGPDRVRYLNAVLTGNVRDLAVGRGTIGLLLNPQGHILAELTVLTLEDRLLILAHAFLREKTFTTLDKFIIMDDAVLSDETAATATLAIEGPEAAAIVRQLTGTELSSLPDLGHVAARVNTAAGTIACRVIHRSSFGFPGAEFLVARNDLPALWNAASADVRKHGGAPIGYRTFNVLRLEAGIPWFGADFDERQIPHEAALEQTHISYTKGCYTGQEIVERVRSRGHVNRRRTGLMFSGAEPPVPGAPLTAPGAAAGQSADIEAGYVTSAAFSPRAGQAIGMGYLRREYAQPGDRLRCGEVDAQIIELPLQ